jgi:hypothetical protein
MCSGKSSLNENSPRQSNRRPDGSGGFVLPRVPDVLKGDIMNVLDFQDRTMPLPPPSDTQLRRLAPDLNKITFHTMLLLLSDRTTPFLATPPIWKDDESLRLLRLVETHLMPEVFYRLKARTRRDCGEKPSSERDRWMRLTKETIITVAVVALAGFVGGYNSRAPERPRDAAVAPSPEIRRAIPVEPEIRKAIPVQIRERRASK